MKKNTYEKLIPIFKDTKDCIILCANNSFASLMGVLVWTIAKYASAQRKYDIIVLHSEIEEENIRKFDFLNTENVSVRFYDVNPIVKKMEFYTSNRKGFTNEAYYRMMTPWILDESYEKALYLDSDMICLSDIKELMETDISDYMLAAVRDYWGICNCYMPDDDRKEYRESIGIENQLEYVISATLLMNLAKWREKYTLDAMWKLVLSKKWRQHDQDVINIMCKGQIKIISAKWGFVTDYGNNHYLPQNLLDELEQAESAPIIFHYAAARKPWKISNHLYNYMFWENAYQTPFMEDLLTRVQSEEYRNFLVDKYTDKKIEEREVERPNGEVAKRIFWREVDLGNPTPGNCQIRVLRIEDSCLYIEGALGVYSRDAEAELKIIVDANDIKYPADYQYCEDHLSQDKTEIFSRSEAFRVKIPIDDANKIMNVRLCFEYNHELHYRDSIGFSSYSPLTRFYDHSYYINNGYMIYTNRKQIFVRKSNAFLKFKQEFCLGFDLMKKKHFKSLVVRKVGRFLNIFRKKRRIWLISDRLMKADDNGEAFFRYLNEEHKNDIESYFILSRESADYERLSKIGKVIEPRSFKHKFLHLAAECCVSAQTDAIYRCPFKSSHPYRDILVDIPFVFLQHGVITADLSRWLKRSRQQLAGFIVSTNDEYNLIKNGEYDYQDEIWLTGMPRFDYREDEAEKIITVMPTWRRYLTLRQNKVTGYWDVISGFKDSTYVTFYRNLLNNERLHRCCEEYGYKLRFRVHPSFIGNESEFGIDETKTVIDSASPYGEIYKTSSLLLTDFSSSIYDFAYLHKPVLYCQFDTEEFFSGKHSYDQGDADFEKNGFGEVTYDLESIVDMLIEYIKNDCKVKPMYEERIQKCFKYHDHKNSERIYNKIEALLEERKLRRGNIN